jgi:hypothetical protein
MKFSRFLLMGALLPLEAFSQASDGVSLYAGFAPGYSHAGYTNNNWGWALNTGLTLSYSDFSARFVRALAIEDEGFFTGDKIASNSILVGYSLQLPTDWFHIETRLNARIGLGNIESTRRANIYVLYMTGPRPPLIIESSNATVWELEFDARLNHFVGFNWSVFSNDNPIRKFYIFSAGVLVGFF